MTCLSALGPYQFCRPGSCPFTMCSMSALKRHVRAALVTTMTLLRSSMLQISWGPSPHCLLYIHSLCLYMVDLSFPPNALSVSSAASIHQRCGLFFYFSHGFARVLSQQPKFVQTTPTMLLLHMHLSRVERIISPTRGRRLVAGPSHLQLSKALLLV